MPAPDDDPDAHAAQADEPDAAAVAQLKPERALNPEFVALFDSFPRRAGGCVEPSRPSPMIMSLPARMVLASSSPRINAFPAMMGKRCPLAPT